MVLVCHKHYLPTYLYIARVFTVFEKLVAYLYRMRISRVRACTPTNLRMCNATYSPVKPQEGTAPRVSTLMPFIDDVMILL